MKKNGTGISLKKFVADNLDEIPPKSLEFLHTDFSMDLNLYSECNIGLSKPQMRVLLKYKYYPSDNMILAYSGYLDLTLFKLLFEYNVKIPENVVYQWRVLEYYPALCYYLQHGGNPNIRPFQFSKRYNIFQPSLIDVWIAQQENPEKSKSDLDKINKVVQMLKKYGAEPSPYAMTFKQKSEYDKLQFDNPSAFISMCQEKIDYIGNKLRTMPESASQHDEYFWSMERYQQDIEFVRSMQ